MWPDGKASPIVTAPARALSSQSGDGGPSGSTSHTTGDPGANRGGHALAVGEAEQVVEVLVDALRLPLPVDAAGPLGDGVVVALAFGDAALEALAQRGDELDGELGAHRGQRSFADRGR